MYYKHRTAPKMAVVRERIISRVRDQLECHEIHPIDTVSPGCDGCHMSMDIDAVVKEMMEGPIHGICKDSWELDFHGESLMTVLRRQDHLVSIGTLSQGDVTSRVGVTTGETMAAYLKEARHCVTTHEDGNLLKATDLKENGFKCYNLMMFNTEEGAQKGERAVKILLEKEAGCYRWSDAGCKGSVGWRKMQNEAVMNEAVVPAISSGILQWDWGDGDYEDRPGKRKVYDGFMSQHEREYADGEGPRAFTSLFICLVDCCAHQYNWSGEMTSVRLGKEHSFSLFAKRVTIRPGSERYIDTKERIAAYGKYAAADTAEATDSTSSTAADTAEATDSISSTDADSTSSTATYPSAAATDALAAEATTLHSIGSRC